ncbi:MAG: hypothetical protein J3Q66DRAFT_382506 [Benniella sp.]|nr:MAG: hypothetical protein J3Q66DRAFT_382506 [Benniella sp.]
MERYRAVSREYRRLRKHNDRKSWELTGLKRSSSIKATAARNAVGGQVSASSAGSSSLVPYKASSVPHANFLGSKVVKLVYGIETFLAEPRGNPGNLTDTRNKYIKKIPNRRVSQKALGTTWMRSDIEAATKELLAPHSPSGTNTWKNLVLVYNVHHRHDKGRPEELVEAFSDLEKVSEYRFRNLTLLQEALTKTATRNEPSYERLEYLGDSVLDLVAAEFWVRRDAVPDLAMQSVDNSTLQALCLEPGLDRFLRNVPTDENRRMAAAKAATEKAKRLTADNKEYWSQVQTLEVSLRRRDKAHKLGQTFMSSDIEAATAQLLAIHSSTGSRVLRHLITRYRSQHDREHNRPDATVSALADVEEILGYDFWDITLLEEALTKVRSADGVPCYDRLEYLGDAVLDLISADFWVRRGEPADTASASVNDEVFQALCLELGTGPVRQGHFGQGSQGY